MVPPEGIDKIQPTTLPADFGEWDSGDAPAEAPVEVNGFDRFPGSVAAPKPPTKPATARVAVLPAADRMPPSAPPPLRKPVRRYPEPEPVYQVPQSQDADLDDLQEMDEKKAKQKKMFIAAGVAALVLAAGAVGYLKLNSKPAPTNQPTTTQVITTGTTGAAETTETASSAPLKPGATPAANSPQTTAPVAAPPEAPSGLGSRQSEAMSRSLNAPSRISTDLKALGASQAAPTSGFSPAGMDMGNGNGIFTPGNGPKVKVEAPKKVSISAGIAVVLLVQKTAPVYPPIARSARVSGTVVIQATISRNGAIESPRAVSGPAMLRQAALDAVKTWRFRPYLLDGQPVEVDTTVNVVFNLGS
ncbi:MAG: energy transducer TonB [Terracidiphilus sp.]